MRLETVVRRGLPGCSRRVVRRLIDDGRVTLNGRRATKGTPVHDGDVVVLPPLAPLAPEPGLGAIVVHADDRLAVVNKPAGIPTLPLDPEDRGTLAGFVLARLPDCVDVGALWNVGIAHRLDTGTSGLVLVARSNAMWATLRTAFRTHRIRKRYVAVVHGRPPAATLVDHPLEHDPRDRRRMRLAPPGTRAWPARTRVRVLTTSGGRSLVCATIHTGVTHQVRAHLASLGAPVVGDVLYGAPSGTIVGRHALHAVELLVPPLLDHPGGRFGSPFPAALAALL